MGAELMRASDLSGPSISGTVQVTLVELDQMRTDHAKAVQLAKQLEEKQAMVKVILGTKQVSPAKYDRFGHKVSNAIEEFVQTGVEYRGFEEFRSQIAKEEKAKVDKHVDDLLFQTQEAENKANKADVEKAKTLAAMEALKETTDLAIKKANDRIVEIKALQPELNENYEKLQKRNDQLVSEIMAYEKQVQDFIVKSEKLTDDIKNLQRANSELRKSIIQWQYKKTFWGWLTAQFNKKEE